MNKSERRTIRDKIMEIDDNSDDDEGDRNQEVVNLKKAERILKALKRKKKVSSHRQLHIYAQWMHI